MKNKINNIKRFLTLLFTDKDILSDSAGSHEEKNDIALPLSEPEWVSVVPESLLEDDEPDFYQVTPENVGPEKEEVTTKLFRKKKRIEKSDLVPSSEQPKKEAKRGKILDEKDKIILWLTPDQNNTVSVDTEALKRHMLVVGMTGSGKTTMLERMILQDIDAGRGVGLIDPHGDLYDKILHQIPKSRSNDVVLFDLTDVRIPYQIQYTGKYTISSLLSVASSIVWVFKRYLVTAGVLVSRVCPRNATLTLLERDGSTLLRPPLLLSDEEFRHNYIAKVTNPFLRRFWADEFNALSSTKQTEGCQSLF